MEDNDLQKLEDYQKYLVYPSKSETDTIIFIENYFLLGSYVSQ